MDLWVTFGLLLLFVTVAAVEAGTISGDLDALMAFRQGVSDPQHALDSWDANLVDPCTWFHITCDNNKRVIRIDLMRQGLSGNVSPQLGNIDSLVYLELYGNNFNGNIPQELGNLVNLRSLDLYNNQFSGRIPSSLGKLNLLYFFRLNNNQLTGSIPGELGDIPTLVAVDVSSNNLCGPVPMGGSLSKIHSYNYDNNTSINKPC
ncbi:leucine-rich repeat protein 1-like [Impatiens glandulifera]|uniref:leucine-rich repeat protein 1-like n=1 Tax=Impatiens glandulifera TaxID=253017 RepID=UPI001FB07D14|nr:leucine-rich repeat protein 1-like [Impatiens glandulifera]